MSVRLNKLLLEANIGLQSFSAILKALDIDEPHLEPSTKISDNLANLILNFVSIVRKWNLTKYTANEILRILFEKYINKKETGAYLIIALK